MDQREQAMTGRISLVGIGLIVMLVVNACGCNPSEPDTVPTLTVETRATVIATNTPTAADRRSIPPSVPAFPLGFMGVYLDDQAPEAFSQIAVSGFNVIQEFRAIQEIDKAEDYLYQAAAAGLYVVQNLPACRAYSFPHTLCQEYDIEVWSEQEWAEFISTLATHENLVAWYLPDEITDYKAAANLYEWIKAYDPQQRPVYGNPGTFEFAKIARFPSFSDFVWTACYPEFYQEPRAIVTYGVELDAKATQGTDDRWGAILQFFDGADHSSNGGHPTARELRADSYQAIIGGATGLWYYSYALGKDLPDLWEAAVRIADEINGSGALAEVILSPGVPQTIVQTVLSGPSHASVRSEVYDSIQMRQKEHYGTYLLTVNVASDDIVVRFDRLPAEAVAVEVLFEDRTLPVSDRSFEDTFTQEDVHIYFIITGS
jgi:hypothetical protein